MPLPLLWIVGAVAASAAGYAAKKILDNDDSSSSNGYSSYEEESRLRAKADELAYEDEKNKKIEFLRNEFARAGENYSRDISSSLYKLVALNFYENPAFTRRLGDEFARSSVSLLMDIGRVISPDQDLNYGPNQIVTWAVEYCTPETQANLSFFVSSYAVEISPDMQFDKLSRAIEDSKLAIDELNKKKIALLAVKDRIGKDS